MDNAQYFNDSYERLVYTENTAFFDRFYANFMSKSPVIAEMFHKTDMQRQKQMLRESLILMVVYSATREGGADMVNLALLHRKLGITPEQFDWWLDAMIEAATLTDTYFKPEHAQAWRIILTPGIDFMKSYLE